MADVTTITSPDDIHARLADRLTRAVGPKRFAMWFERSARFAYQDQQQTLQLAVPNRFVADWIDRHFAEQLREAIDAELGTEVALDVQVDTTRFDAAAGATKQPAAGVPANGRGQGRDPRGPAATGTVPDARGGELSRPGARAAGPPRSSSTAPDVRDGFFSHHVAPLRHRLDSFIVGDSNRLAHAAVRRLADAPAADPQAGHPVFLHGNCGLGKTHLLQGTCTRLLERDPRARVLYTTGEQFTNAYITAVRTNRLDAFRRRVRGLDLLAVDDVHFIANKRATQQEFLHSFDQIELGGARVILASDCHPKLIKQFTDALVSRCVRGLVVQMHRPDSSTRLKLVEELTRRRGLHLQANVAGVLADRSEGSVREIEGMLTKLHALASLGGGRGTADGGRGSGGSMAGGATHELTIGHALLRQLFDGQTPGVRTRRPVRFSAIVAGVAGHLGVTRQQIMGRGRHKIVVLARSMTIHLARQLTSMSYPEIAAAMGRKNHSTIITAAKRVEKQLAANEPLLLPGREAPVTPRELVEQLRRRADQAAE